MRRVKTVAAEELRSKYKRSDFGSLIRGKYINLAVAEKLSALRTEEYFGKRGDIAKAKRLLKRAGSGNPPPPGDEVD